MNNLFAHTCPLSRRAVASALLAAFALAAQTGCATLNKTEAGSMQSAFHGSTFAFDTYCTFTVFGDNRALSQLTAACARYSDLFDLYCPTSDIARINTAHGAPVSVAAETCELIELGRSYSEQANGLFDITIGAVSTLWDFKAGVRPSDTEICHALEHIDWRCVTVDREAQTVQLADPDAKLDLGGIAKGFVADKLVELLRTHTAASAAVLSLGGNIITYGTKPDGTAWNVGIRDPSAPDGEGIIGTARLDAGMSLVTSGLYERTFKQDGTTYWHILDPKTGYPVATDTESVSVAGPSSTAADALSTTLFVAGSTKGRDLIDMQKRMAALFVLDTGEQCASTRWNQITSFQKR